MGRLIQRFNTIGSYFSLVILGVLVLYIFADVVGRYGFSHPFPDDVDIGSLILYALAAVSLSYVTAEGGQIEVGGLVEKFSPRVQSAVRIVVLVTTIGIFALLFVASIGNIGAAMSRETSILHMKIWPWRVILPIAVFFLILELLRELVISFRQLLKKTPPATKVEVTEASLLDKRGGV